MSDSAAVKYRVPLTKQKLVVARAQGLEYRFPKVMVEIPDTPNHDGFNTRMSHGRGHTVEPATTAVYMPVRHDAS